MSDQSNNPSEKELARNFRALAIFLLTINLFFFATTAVVTLSVFTSSTTFASWSTLVNFFAKILLTLPLIGFTSYVAFLSQQFLIRMRNELKERSNIVDNDDYGL